MVNFNHFFIQPAPAWIFRLNPSTTASSVNSLTVQIDNSLASSEGNSLAKIGKSIMNNSEFKVRDC
jgi:hypothetical protein